MPTRTPDQLAERVLRDMNFIRPGRDPDKSQVAEIVDRYKTNYAALVRERLATWPRDHIPDDIFDTLAMHMAVTVAPSFGALPIVLQSMGEQSAMGAKERLRRDFERHAAVPYQYEPVGILEY